MATADHSITIVYLYFCCTRSLDLQCFTSTYVIHELHQLQRPNDNGIKLISHINHSLDFTNQWNKIRVCRTPVGFFPFLFSCCATSAAVCNFDRKTYFVNAMWLLDHWHRRNLFIVFHKSLQKMRRKSDSRNCNGLIEQYRIRKTRHRYWNRCTIFRFYAFRVETMYIVLPIRWLRNRSTAQNKIERTNQKTDDKAVLVVRFVAPGNLILFKYMSFIRIAHVLNGSNGSNVVEHRTGRVHIWGGTVNRRSVDNFLINRNELFY